MTRKGSPRRVVALAALATLALAVPAQAAPTPGAPGLGDSIYPKNGNGGYDVQHYDIRLNYQPATDELWGQTTILAVTTQELSQFNLDFALKVRSVRVNNALATFRVDAEDKTELIVTPAQPVANGRPMTVVVDYADIPSTVQVNGVQVWRRTADGAIVVGQWRNSETWFPANDHPSDKATYDVSVAVPDGTVALSNGILTGQTPVRPGWTRWSWRSSEPMVTYLPFLAMGQFEFNQGTTPSGLPYYTGYDKLLGDLLPVAKRNIERTVEITDFLAGKFGPYPFSSLGGVATSAWPNGALENQTRPVYGTTFWSEPEPSWVLAHELAHQWFGDSVSIQWWKHMWLNEGFATYAEWLWSEHRGAATADQLADAFYAKYPAEDAFWQHVVYPTNHIFHTAVYQRGAMALHAMRTAVGDDTFFRILQSYHANNRLGHATTEEFIAEAERLSGQELDALFTLWLTTPGRPPVGPNGTAVTNAGTPAAVAEMARMHEHLIAHGHGHGPGDGHGH